MSIKAMERTRRGIGLLLATGCSRGPLIAEPFGKIGALWPNI
jgi:hypothetical protein